MKLISHIPLTQATMSAPLSHTIIFLKWLSILDLANIHQYFGLFKICENASHVRTALYCAKESSLIQCPVRLKNVILSVLIAHISVTNFDISSFTMLNNFYEHLEELF